MYGGKTKWISKKLNGYTGPYPYQMLNDARYTLMKAIEMKDTVIWSRIRSKTGIFENRLREAGFHGWGEASTYFSHADLLEENVTEGRYQPRQPLPTQATSTASATVTTGDVDLESSNEEESISSDAVDKLKDETPSVEKSNDTSRAEIETPNYMKKKDGFDLKPLEKRSPKKVKQSRTELASNLLPNNASNISIDNEEGTVRETGDLEEGEIIDIDDDCSSTIEISDDTELEITVENITDSDPVILIEDNDVASDINGNSGSKSVKGDTLPNVSSETKCSSSQVQGDVIVIDPPERKDVSPTDDEIHQSETSVVHLDNHGINQVRDKESQLELHSGNDKTSDKNRNPRMSPVFKCDFCTTVCESHSSMTEHLKIATHFSASKVNRDRQTGHYKLLDKLVIMNKDNLFKGTVAVCPHPTCHEICQTIYTCALHHRLKHDSVGKLTYGLADVLQTTEFINPCATMACPVCHDSFNKEKAHREGLRNRISTWNKFLTGHFKEKNHYPFDYTKGECYFICPDCHYIFKDLNRVLSHQTIHQVLPVSHDMKVIAIQLGEVRICELPETYQHRDNVSASIEDMVDKNANTPANTGTKETEAPYKSLTIDNGLFVIDREPMPVPRLSDKPAPDNSTISVSQSNDTKSTDEVNDKNNQSAASQNGANNIQQKTIQKPHSQAEALASENLHSLESRYVFLCDYCNTQDQDRHIIYQHLVQECHSSASTVLVDRVNNPTTLFKPKSIENYRALYKKVVAACPMSGCLSIFGDVYECTAHCRVFHGCNENIYGLRKIVQVFEEHHPANLVCRYCKKTFENKKVFNRHVKKENHVPHVCRKEYLSIYLQFVCLYCKQMHQSYEQLICHIECRHVTKAINDLYKVQILLISKDVKKKWILPFSCDAAGEARSIDMNLVSMRTLKDGKGKHIKRKIQQQIEELCLLKAKKQKQI